MGPATLDQLVVAAEHWGSQLADTLVDEAKRLSPDRITLLVNTDNARAIRFYRRNGFAFAGEDVNPTRDVRCCGCSGMDRRPLAPFLQGKRVVLPRYTPRKSTPTINTT